MNTVFIWLLISIPGWTNQHVPPTLIARFADKESCVAVHKQLEENPYRLRCVPAKVFIGKEQT